MIRKIEGMVCPHLPRMVGTREDQLRELRKHGKNGKMSMCIAEFIGNIDGEAIGILYNHGVWTPDRVWGSSLIGLITHNTHSFIGVNYLPDRIVLLGYVVKDMVQYFLVSEILHSDYESGLKWYPFESLSKTHPRKRRYEDKLRSLNIIPKEDRWLDPDRKREIMATAIRQGNGVIYVTAHNNNSVPKHGASGNMYLKSYKEKADKIQFMFAFYGTVEGEYVGFDETSRGSLEPNYKMLAAGYGKVVGDERHLFISFTHKKQIYIFRYCIEGDKKPKIGMAYHIRTDDDRTKKLLKEVPSELIVSSDTKPDEIGGKPLFYVNFSGSKVESSVTNDLQLEEEMRPVIKSKGKAQAINLEDAEKFFAERTKTHIKPMPEVINPNEGLIDKKRVFASVIKNINKLEADNVNLLQQDNTIQVNIIHDDGSIALRMKITKTEISLAYLNEDERWKTIKRYNSETQGKSVGRLIKIVKENLEEEGEEDE